MVREPYQMGPDGHFVDRSIDCIGCRACEEACLYNALDICGETKTEDTAESREEEHNSAAHAENTGNNTDSKEEQDAQNQ